MKLLTAALLCLLALTACTFAPPPTSTPAPFMTNTPRPTLTAIPTPAPVLRRIPYTLPVTRASFTTDGCFQRTSGIQVDNHRVYWLPDDAGYQECVKRLQMTYQPEAG